MKIEGMKSGVRLVGNTFIRQGNINAGASVREDELADTMLRVGTAIRFEETVAEPAGMRGQAGEVRTVGETIRIWAATSLVTSSRATVLAGAFCKESL